MKHRQTQPQRIRQRNREMGQQELTQNSHHHVTDDDHHEQSAAYDVCTAPADTHNTPGTSHLKDINTIIKNNYN